MKKPIDTVQLKLRFSERLRGRLERAAAKNQDSMNAEIVRRLERSFADEDIVAAALGGKELRHRALMMISTFAEAGEAAAASKGIADATPRDWLKDQECYRAAFLGVATILLRAAPDQSVQAMEDTLQSLIGRVGGILTASGKIKFDFGDGRGPVGSGFVSPKEDE